MTIVEALEKLKVEGLAEDHDHVIETVLSKLFVRGDEVHKAYKHRTADFADLADRDTRHQWITEDFHWNNIMAPEIYLELRHVARDGGHYVHIDPSRSEDLYIVMRRFDKGRDLLTLLEKNAVESEHLATYARLLTERLKTLTELKRGSLSGHIERGNAHLKDEVLGVCDWAYTATPYLTTEDVDAAQRTLASALEQERYFNRPLDLSVVIDTNPDNIIILEDGISFIDVMPPKDSWRIHDRYFALCRTSTDVSTLDDHTKADILHETFGSTENLPSETVRKTYELAAGLIQVPYRKMLGREDLATKYADFVKRTTEELRDLLDASSH
jgi:aminoglycoside phosphotransferase family enzyme